MKLSVFTHLALLIILIPLSHALPQFSYTDIPELKMPGDSCWTGGKSCENQNSAFCLKEHKGICKSEGRGPFASTECNDNISVQGPCDPRGASDLSSHFCFLRFGTIWFGCDIKWQGTRKWRVASVSHVQSLSRTVTAATHGNPDTTSWWRGSGFRKWSHAMYLYFIRRNDLD